MDHLAHLIGQQMLNMAKGYLTSASFAQLQQSACELPESFDSSNGLRRAVM